MYGKIIISFVLGAFVSVQLAQGNGTTPKQLQCFTSEKKVTCNETVANVTRSKLQLLFSNITNTTSPNFECVYLNVTTNTTSATDKSISIKSEIISGCIFSGAFKCDMNSTSVNVSQCAVCENNLCNPAGTFSSSTSIMISSIFALILARLFIM